MYDNKFYDKMIKRSRVNNKTSAQIIVPIVMDLIQPQSVVDVGCAQGVWLDVFKKAGNVKKVLGIDGDWVDTNKLLISKEDFLIHDLEKRLILDKKYDLAISLEVAEHISQEHANDFVDNLINSSDCILFGAAIPNQGGTHHINEQWQSYWIKKFKMRGYICFDYIRPIIWNNNRVSLCYAQNTFLFIKESMIDQLNLRDKLYNDRNFISDCVHPKLFDIGVTNEQDIKHILSLQLKIIRVLRDKLKKVIFR